MIPSWITDYPAAWLGLLGAAMTLAVSFGVTVTPDQVRTLGEFFAALFVVIGAIGHVTTVPKTPSSISAPEQSPAPLTAPK